MNRVLLAALGGLSLAAVRPLPAAAAGPVLTVPDEVPLQGGTVSAVSVSFSFPRSGPGCGDPVVFTWDEQRWSAVEATASGSPPTCRAAMSAPPPSGLSGLGTHLVCALASSAAACRTLAIVAGAPAPAPTATRAPTPRPGPPTPSPAPSPTSTPSPTSEAETIPSPGPPSPELPRPESTAAAAPTAGSPSLATWLAVFVPLAAVAGIALALRAVLRTREGGARERG